MTSASSTRQHEDEGARPGRRPARGDGGAARIAGCQRLGRSGDGSPACEPLPARTETWTNRRSARRSGRPWAPCSSRPTATRPVPARCSAVVTATRPPRRTGASTSRPRSRRRARQAREACHVRHVAGRPGEAGRCHSAPAAMRRGRRRARRRRSRVSAWTMSCIRRRATRRPLLVQQLHRWRKAVIDRQRHDVGRRLCGAASTSGRPAWRSRSKRANGARGLSNSADTAGAAAGLCASRPSGAAPRPAAAPARRLPVRPPGSCPAWRTAPAPRRRRRWRRSRSAPAGRSGRAAPRDRRSGWLRRRTDARRRRRRGTIRRGRFSRRTPRPRACSASPTAPAPAAPHRRRRIGGARLQASALARVNRHRVRMPSLRQPVRRR